MDAVLELDEYAGIDAPTRKIVGYGIIVVFRIGNPIVGVDVVDAEQVEGIYAEPDVPEVLLPACMEGVLLIVQQAVAHTDVDTAVSRCPE